MPTLKFWDFLSCGSFGPGHPEVPHAATGNGGSVGARRFETLGQRDDAAVVSMGTTVEFHDKIGIDRIETRVRELATRLKDHLRDRVPGARFHTPADPTLSAGVVVFEPPVADTRQAYNQLYEQYGIACAAMSGQFNGIRLCPHVYNTLDEVERVVEVVADLS